jgi:hypothetical protein
VLWAAVASLLRDMRATGQALPDIREEAHEDRGEDAVCAWIQEPGGGSGQGVAVLLFCSPGDRLRFLAEQLQDWAGDVQVDPGRRPWPGCPDHPGAHILRPDTHDEVAVWCCPQSGHVIAGIECLPDRDVPVSFLRAEFLRWSRRPCRAGIPAAAPLSARAMMLARWWRGGLLPAGAESVTGQPRP